MIAITVYSLLGGLVFAMNGKLLHKKISLASWIAYFIGGAFVTLGFYNIVGDPFTRFPQLQELIPDFITQWVLCSFSVIAVVLCLPQIKTIEKKGLRILCYFLVFLILASVFSDCCVLPIVKWFTVQGYGKLF